MHKHKINGKNVRKIRSENYPSIKKLFWLRNIYIFSSFFVTSFFILILILLFSYFVSFRTGLNACEKKSYVFLRKELPVRLANIMKEIALLPDSLSRTQSVGLVSSWYERSFEEVLRYEQLEPTNMNMERCVFLLYISKGCKIQINL